MPAGTINQTLIAAANTDGLSTVPKQPRTFGEAQIDLRLLFQSDECVNFGSMFVKSRCSTSFTSAFKDFIAPIPVQLSNCGSVTIRKQTLPDEDPNTTLFGYTATSSPTRSWPDFSLTDDGVKTFVNVVQGGYPVDESTPHRVGVRERRLLGLVGLDGVHDHRGDGGLHHRLVARLAGLHVHQPGAREPDDRQATIPMGTRRRSTSRPSHRCLRPASRWVTATPNRSPISLPAPTTCPKTRRCPPGGR